MSERIVDELKVIEVEVEHRKMLASANSLERLIKLLAELCSIGQIGQRIMVRGMGDALSRSP